MKYQRESRYNYNSLRLVENTSSASTKSSRAV